MTDASELGLTPQEELREERRRQKHYQKRLKEITQIMTKWNAFENSLNERPTYYRALRLLQAEISQRWNVEKNRQLSECRRQSILLGKQVKVKLYSWNAARKAVLTQERLDAMSKTHNVDPDDIFTDVGKLANHASWMSGIYDRREGGILADVNRGLEPQKYSPPVIVQPAAPPPLVLRAAEINQFVARANAEHERIEREFHSDDPPQPPKTQTFDFLKEVDSQTFRISAYATKPLKRPRKNWRKEIE